MVSKRVSPPEAMAGDTLKAAVPCSVSAASDRLASTPGTVVWLDTSLNCQRDGEVSPGHFCKESRAVSRAVR